MTTEKYSLAWLLIFLTAITAYRALILANYDLTLYIDEAYYWVWAQHLDWGYYSKPPVIAALISAVTSVCGHSETCIRSPGIILYPLTALGIYATGRELAGGRVGLWAALLFITMPAISLSSFVASTDVPLLLCWSWALYLFIKALIQLRDLLHLGPFVDGYRKAISPQPSQHQAMDDSPDCIFAFSSEPGVEY
jgi:4-amino-4-deoxy-L-arabinose transferase-like glycosyltransferase